MLISSDDESGGLRVTVEAPFYNSPASSKENVRRGTFFRKKTVLVTNTSLSFLQLHSNGVCPERVSVFIWKFEVLEVYFLNDEGRYFQIEFSPDGRYITILFEGYRDKVMFKRHCSFLPC